MKLLVGIHGTYVAVMLLHRRFSKEVATQGGGFNPHLTKEDILEALSSSVNEISREEMKC